MVLLSFATRLKKDLSIIEKCDKSVNLPLIDLALFYVIRFLKLLQFPA